MLIVYCSLMHQIVYLSSLGSLNSILGQQSYYMTVCPLKGCSLIVNPYPLHTSTHLYD